MRVHRLVVNVDDADQLPSAYQRNGKKCLVGIFRQFLKALEAGVARGVRSQRHHALMLRHPTGDTFAHLHPDVADFLGVRELRGAQYDLLAVPVYQVNQARIAIRHLHGEPDQLLEHFLQRQIGAYNVANLVQQLNLGFAFHYGHNPSVRSAPQAVQSKISIGGITLVRSGIHYENSGTRARLHGEHAPPRAGRSARRGTGGGLLRRPQPAYRRPLRRPGQPRRSRAALRFLGREKV